MKEVVRAIITDRDGDTETWEATYRAEYETPAGTCEGHGWSHLNVEELVLEQERTHQGQMVRKVRSWAQDCGFKVGPPRPLDYQTGFEMKLTRP